MNRYINWLNTHLPKGSFIRNISILLSGTVSAQAMVVLATPILTRLYSPDDFGLLAAFTALLTFFSVVSSARYELAIPLPENEQDAADLVILSICIVLAMTIITFLFFLYFSNNIAELLSTPNLTHYLLLIPVGVLFSGLYQVFSAWSIRKKKFGVIARTKVYQSFTTLFIQLGGFFLGPISLMIGQAGGQGVGGSALARSALKEKEFKNISLNGIKKQLIRYKDFPLYSSATALFNTASLQFAPLIFITLYGAVVSGLYALTLRILSMPIGLIGNAIGSVFLSEAPKAHREGRLPELILSLNSKLSFIGAFPLAVLIFFSPELFTIIFGAEWQKAGVYARWMAPWIYLQLQWSPLSTLASILELQRAALISQILTFAFRFGSLIIVWLLNFTSDLAIFIFAVVSALTYLLRMVWFMDKANVSVTKIIFTNIKYLSMALIPVGFLWYSLESI